MDTTTLENWLWEAACSIRGPLDAPKFKDYILPLLSYKRLSDVYEDELIKLDAARFGSGESMTPPLTADALRARVDVWAKRLGVQVQRVQIRAMRNKWASCSSNGTLTLNADVLRLPLDLVDYVLCHDLLHLRAPDHGKGFRVLMGCYLPDWRKREMALARWMASR